MCSSCTARWYSRWFSPRGCTPTCQATNVLGPDELRAVTAVADTTAGRAESAGACSMMHDNAAPQSRETTVRPTDLRAIMSAGA